MRATPDRILMTYSVIDGYMLVLLPSETRRFREAIAPIAVPLNLGPHSRRTAYRITEEQWPQFLATVAELYPRWHPFRSIPAPPWAEHAMQELREATAQSSALRVVATDDSPE